jgi:UDP-glucose 4-epimerase
MSRILVTGGAGFVGSHVVDRLLVAGARVSVIDDLSTGTRANMQRAAGHGLRDEDVRILDICTAECADWVQQWRPDVVMHLAAQASVARSVADPVRDARVNIVGTLNVLDAAVRAGVRKVVFASSGGTIYGEPTSGTQRVPEDTPYRPISPYGLAKAAANGYLSWYGQLLGLTSTVLALGNVYGPRQADGGTTGVVADFVTALQNGTPPVFFGDGSQSRDFVYITDVAEAFLLAADKGDGTVLNIGTGVATPIRDVLALVCAAMGVDAEPDLRASLPAEVHRSVLDPLRAATVLGWTPRVELPDGVRLVVEYSARVPSC